MTIPDALDTLQRFMAYPVVPNSTTILLNVVAIAQRFNISPWDASIVAATSSLGSKTLYTEDLNNGQKYDSILAVNPFETGLSTSFQR
jgi:predicted nucleic acid-binding protein